MTDLRLKSLLAVAASALALSACGSSEVASPGEGDFGNQPTNPTNPNPNPNPGTGQAAADCPTGLANVGTVANGTLRCDVTIAGKAAHSARSWKGINAIHRAAPLLDALDRYVAFTVEVDGLEYREGLNAVRISGGIAGNVIPDSCVVTLNFRFAPSLDISHAKRRIEAFVADSFADAASATQWSIVWTDESAAARPGLDAPLAQEFVAAVASTGAGEPRAKLGWTDVARFGELGIPAVNFGPGDPELAHADDERCPVVQIRSCLDALGSWLGATSRP